MATTIIQSFLQLKANLEITGLQQQTVSTRQRNVRDAITTDLTVLDTFLTGSYRRSTMISPLKDADVDVFVVLDSSYFKQDGQAWLLDKVKTTLKKTYPTVILPFFGGVRSRSVTRPWPAADWVSSRLRPCLGVHDCRSKPSGRRIRVLRQGFTSSTDLANHGARSD